MALNPFTKGEPIKSGKKSISEKPKVNIEEWGPDGNNLLVPHKLQEHADREGIEFRWLSAIDMDRNSGIHKRGWRIFHFGEVDPVDLGIHDWKFGTQDPGTLRRVNMVLGYKPKEAAEFHRKWLNKKTMAHKDFVKNKAEELRQMTKEAGLDARIIEGYEENK